MLEGAYYNLVLYGTKLLGEGGREMARSSPPAVSANPLVVVKCDPGTGYTSLCVNTVVINYYYNILFFLLVIIINLLLSQVV